jgi:hypothetical protein
MLFNSIDFALFFPIVFFLYWFVAKNNLTAQNLLLLVASYVFYAWWDPRFLLLLMFSTLLGYFTAIWIHNAKTQPWKRFWFWVSVSANIGFLGIFKYYNFFAESFGSMLQSSLRGGRRDVADPVGPVQEGGGGRRLRRIREPHLQRLRQLLGSHPVNRCCLLPVPNLL